MSLTTLRRPSLLAALAIALGCAAAEPVDDGGSGASGGGGGAATGGAGASGGAGGAGGANGGMGGSGGNDCGLVDPCTVHDTHPACCAEAGCSWHHNTGHSLDGVPPCVSAERICVVAGQDVRMCPAGQTCLREGAFQDTADDCVLPQPGMISLLDRGICVCE